MVRVGHFDDHGIDHRQIRGHGNAVVEEVRVLQPPVLVVDIFLVERPADTLRRGALVLAFDVARVDRLAGILGNGEAQDRHLAGLRVDLDVDRLGGEAGARPLDVFFDMRGDGAAGLAGILGDIGNRQRLELTGVSSGGTGVTVLPLDRVDRNIPHDGGAFFQFLHHLVRNVDRRLADGRTSCGCPRSGS